MQSYEDNGTSTCSRLHFYLCANLNLAQTIFIILYNVIVFDNVPYFYSLVQRLVCSVRTSSTTTPLQMVSGPIILNCILVARSTSHKNALNKTSTISHFWEILIHKPIYPSNGKVPDAKCSFLLKLYLWFFSEYYFGSVEFRNLFRKLLFNDV